MNLSSFSLWMEQNALLIALACLGLSLITLIFFIHIYLTLVKYRQLLKGSKGLDLEGLLLNLSEKTQIVYTKLGKFEEEFVNNRVLEQKHLQHVGLVRFKAFQNSGGDQSFALSVLDANGNGIVMSSIFGRDEARVYCKPVENGSSSYPLSEEEKEAIKKAIPHGLKA